MVYRLPSVDHKLAIDQIFARRIDVFGNRVVGIPDQQNTMETIGSVPVSMVSLGGDYPRSPASRVNCTRLETLSNCRSVATAAGEP